MCSKAREIGYPVNPNTAPSSRKDDPFRILVDEMRQKNYPLLYWSSGEGPGSAAYLSLGTSHLPFITNTVPAGFEVSDCYGSIRHNYSSDLTNAEYEEERTRCALSLKTWVDGLPDRRGVKADDPTAFNPSWHTSSSECKTFTAVEAALEEYLPSRWLQLLPEEPDLREDAIAGILRNPRTPKRVLEIAAECIFFTAGEYAEGIPESCMIALAQNPGSPTDMLDCFTCDENRFEYVIENPSLSPAALIASFTDDDESVLENVLNNPDAAPDLIEALICRYHRYELLSHPKTPQTLLEQLYATPDPTLLGYIAANPEIPFSWVEALVPQAEHFDIAVGLARNPMTPSSFIEGVLKHGYESYSIANNPKLPARAITWMALSEDVLVRMGAAENTSCPPETLRMLSQDEDISVREGVASNPSAPTELLEELLALEDGPMFEALAENPNIPCAVLRCIANCREPRYRALVAKSPAAPQSLVEELTQDRNAGVVEAAFANLR